MFPQAILFGMSYEEFWEDNPQLFWSYGRAYQLRKEVEAKENDISAWNIGQYVLMALYQNSSSMFSKQKKEIFPKKPITMQRENLNINTKGNKIRENFEKYAINFNKNFRKKNNQ